MDHSAELLQERQMGQELLQKMDQPAEELLQEKQMDQELLQKTDHSAELLQERQRQEKLQEIAVDRSAGDTHNTRALALFGNAGSPCSLHNCSIHFLHAASASFFFE